MMSENKRYLSIDFLRGFCVLWIIWYHTSHPEFVNYPFFNATLFFVSGVVFKPYDWKTFLKKRINQLLVPFFFFYILYYIFLILLNYSKEGIVSQDIALSVLGLFKLYTYNDAFIVNYPLWFVLALFNIQIIFNFVVKIIPQEYAILLIVTLISMAGHFYIRTIPTPFMLGKSLPYLLFFAIGYLYGKRLLNCSMTCQSFLSSCVLWFFLFCVNRYMDRTFILVQDLEIVVFACVLLLTSRILESLRIADVFVFYGANSYVVLGLHEMFLTISRILCVWIAGEMNIILGIINLIISMILLYFSIKFLNKYMPIYIGKKDLLEV